MANYSASKDQATRGQYPDVNGLPKDQANEIMDIYRTTRNENIMKGLQESTALPNDTSKGYVTPMGLALLIIVVVIPLWYFAQKEKAKQPKPLSELNPGYYDNANDPPAGNGKINAIDQVYLFPEAKSGAFGSLKHPISQDSIAWLMGKADIKTAPRKKYGGYQFVYLKFIPVHWVKMNDGKKPVTQAWVMENSLHNFSALDSSAYIKARLENF